VIHEVGELNNVCKSDGLPIARNAAPFFIPAERAWQHSAAYADNHHAWIADVDFAPVGQMNPKWTEWSVLEFTCEIGGSHD